MCQLDQSSSFSVKFNAVEVGSSYVNSQRINLFIYCKHRCRNCFIACLTANYQWISAASRQVQLSSFDTTSCVFVDAKCLFASRLNLVSSPFCLYKPRLIIVSRLSLEIIDCIDKRESQPVSPEILISMKLRVYIKLNEVWKKWFPFRWSNKFSGFPGSPNTVSVAELLTCIICWKFGSLCIFVRWVNINNCINLWKIRTEGFSNRLRGVNFEITRKYEYWWSDSKYFASDVCERDRWKLYIFCIKSFRSLLLQ